MKKTLSLMLLGFVMSAQQKQKECYFSASILGDVRNCIIGSDPTRNKPSTDLLIGIHAVGNNFEMNPEVEVFPKIGYWSAGCNFGYHFNNWYLPMRSKEMDLTFVPLAGLKMINRYNQEERITKYRDHIYSKSSHYAIQAGASLRLKVSDKIILDLTSYYSTRPDLNYRWPDAHKSGVLSTYFGFHYILN